MWEQSKMERRSFQSPRVTKVSGAASAGRPGEEGLEPGPSNWVGSDYTTQAPLPGRVEGLASRSAGDGWTY